MSTPIETNTEELQEILQTVYNLPMAGGGSSEPDLVIKLDNPDWLQMTDHPELLTFNSEEVINTYNKLLSGESVNCMLNAHYRIHSGTPIHSSSPQVLAVASNQVYASGAIGHMRVYFNLWYAYDFIGELLAHISFNVYNDGASVEGFTVTKSVAFTSTPV